MHRVLCNRRTKLGVVLRAGMAADWGERMRASWLVDAKWVCGLLCLFCLLAAGLLYSVTALTGRETATGLFTASVGGMVSSQLSDEEYAQIAAAAAQNPEGEYTIGETTLTVKGREIAGLSKDQAVALVVGRIAVVNYEQGPDAAEALITASGEDGKNFSLGPVGPLTQSTHDSVRPYYIGFAVAAVALAVPLVFLSRKFGRLGSPGIVLMLGSAPFALAWRLLEDAASGVNSETGVFASALAGAVAGPASDLSGRFTRLMLVGAGMVVAAIVADICWPLVLRAYKRWIAPRLTASTPAG